MAIESRAGIRYQLEGAETPAGGWRAIGPPLTGTGGLLVAEDAPAPSADTFHYRFRIGGP